MTVAADIVGGGTGHAVAFDGHAIECLVDVPQATGRPVEIVLRFPDGALSLRTKSRGSRRCDDGRFQVWLRPVALRREERARLLAAFGSG
jgi:hypothetical protein